MSYKASLYAVRQVQEQALSVSQEMRRKCLKSGAFALNERSSLARDHAKQDVTAERDGQIYSELR